MSIFGKKSEGEHSVGSDGKPGAPRYGIGEVIRLLRTLPIDQHTDLVVRVIRNTLESLEVHVPDLIQDAVKQERNLGERIGALRARMHELTKQIDAHHEEVSRLETDLAETAGARERLQFTEQIDLAPTPLADPFPTPLQAQGRALPPPLPSRLKSSPPASVDAAHNGTRG